MGGIPRRRHRHRHGHPREDVGEEVGVGVGVGVRVGVVTRGMLAAYTRLKTVIHPSTSWAQHRVPSFMQRTTLTSRQATKDRSHHLK